MRRLPLRPLVFIPIYIALGFFVPAYAVNTGGIDALSLAMAAIFVCTLLHVTWIWRALAFAAGHDPTRGPRRLARARPLALAVALATVLVFAIAWLVPPLAPLGPEWLAAVEPFLIFAMVVGFFMLAWCAARTVCDAEVESGAPSHAAIGTFLALLYLVIGAPFVYGRLRALGAGPLTNSPRAA